MFQIVISLNLFRIFIFRDVIIYFYVQSCFLSSLRQRNAHYSCVAYFLVIIEIVARKQCLHIREICVQQLEIGAS